MNIKSLILKIYRIAFNYSGIKHRDFPYYSYYNFLMSLNNEELDLLKNDFNDLTEEQSELFHIFGYVKLKKLKQIENKKIKEEEEKKFNQIIKMKKKSIKRIIQGKKWMSPLKIKVVVTSFKKPYNLFH